MLSSIVLSKVFQNFIVLSADPPPEASTPWLWGLQAIPFTAAQCDENLHIGVEVRALHTYNLLSFPPEAKRLRSKDHFRPHTYCVCPSYLDTILLNLYLTSRSRMLRSREPLASTPSPQETELTLALWPPNSLTRQPFPTSQVYIVPLLVPIAICVPWWFQLRLEMESGESSQNLRTLLLLAFQK